MTAGRLYIVEDEPLIAMEMRDRLETLGYHIEGLTGDREVALRDVAERKPDIVLMDINLAGGMSGIELAGWIHDNLDSGVIFVTAYSDPRLIDEARAVEPYGYVVKPYDERELHATIQLALSRRSNEIERRVLAEQREARDRRRLRVLKAEMSRWLGAAVTHQQDDLFTVVSRELDIAAANVQDHERCLASTTRAWDAALRAVTSRASQRHCAEPRATGRTVFSLSSLCREIVTELSADLPAGVQFISDVPPTELLVHADPNLLRRTIAPLVTNAVESLDDSRGTIGLHLRETTYAEMRRWHIYPTEWESAPGSYACISISDAGSGMSDNVLGRLFEPFFTTKSFGRGLGLALALSAAISEDGAISVETTPGRGSTFRVLLPGTGIDSTD